MTPGDAAHPPAAFPGKLEGLALDEISGLLHCVAQSGLLFWYSPDVTRGKLWWPPAALRFLGYAPGELHPSFESLGALLHPDDHAWMLARIRAAVQGASFAGEQCECRLRRKDGKYSWVCGMLSLVPDSEAGTLACLGVWRIVDRNELAERATYRLSQVALYTVLNEIGYPVVLMTADGRVLQANDATARHAGRGGTPTLFCPFLHHDDGSPLFPGFLEGVIQEGCPAKRELERFDRWWLIHLVPLRDADHEIDQVLLLAQDITSIKAEQTMQLARERALTGTLVREVHHRIKNHLQGVVGLLRRPFHPQLSPVDAVSAAVAQIQSIATVHGLLARSGQGSIDLGALLRQIITATGSGSSIPVQFRERSTTLEPLALSENEAVPLAVAVGELLTNAAKHTDDVAGAEVRAELSYQACGIDLTIANRPARLPPGFSLVGSGIRHSGLDLVLALLPRNSAELAVWQEQDTVVARLRLRKSGSAFADSRGPKAPPVS